MPKAVELLREGRNEDLWQMCCGYLRLDMDQFMSLQRRLLLGQLDLLKKSSIGRKLMKGAIVQTVEDFRQSVPLTTYADYCPELPEKRVEALPREPAQWIHTSGKSGEYSCKWVPVSLPFIQTLSRNLYGVGLMSSCKGWGDSSSMPEVPKVVYTVAPRPYMSGAIASMLGEQTPLSYYPSLQQAETMHFEDRVKLGFEEALSKGLDYFFGLSFILASVGDKFSQSAGNTDIRAFLSRPKALARLARGMIKARIGGRNMLPKDLWQVKGIITSGLDSTVYREKIKQYWGRYPLDIYACSEGGLIATQTWDYSGMTFIPDLNFFEFIPETEHYKWQSDHNYQPKTVLLNEVKPGESYEIVITNFHGGALMRYRIGDMVRITSLKNENLGIKIPQMEFDRRVDDVIDLSIIRLTEKSIWKAVEATGIPYVDWVAFKKPGELTLNILIETDKRVRISESEFTSLIKEKILDAEKDAFKNSRLHKEELVNSGLNFKATLLSEGTFAKYTFQKQVEGADLAHLKPPHVNITSRELTKLLLSDAARAEEFGNISNEKSPVLAR